MKIRSDFVTNSSSSSFVLGRPKENTVTVKDAKKYLRGLEKKLNLDQKIRAEFFIDLRYDPDKEYEATDISFIIECIEWFTWEQDADAKQAAGLDRYLARGVESLTTDEGEIFELHCWGKEYSRSQIKAIMDFAYHNFGEVIVGNSETGFYPFEAYYEGIAQDKNIIYKNGHMG